jgi:hypothetical protein
MQNGETKGERIARIQAAKSERALALVTKAEPAPAPKAPAPAKAPAPKKTAAKKSTPNTTRRK